MKAHTALSIIPGLSEWKIPTKATLLAAAAALALTTGGAFASSPHPAVSFSGVKSYPFVRPCPCFWNQNSLGDGGAIDSQNFSAGFAGYDDAAADDFAVTAATTVNGIDVSGTYFGGTGLATSANVTFYNDVVIGTVHQPGTQVVSYTGQVTNDNGAGSFHIVFQLCKTNAKGVVKCKDKPFRLKGGRKKTPVTYWVSVVANCDLSGCGEWGWDTRPLYGTTNPAVWQNPGGLFPPGCTTWSNLNNACIGYTLDDFMYDLF